MARVREILDGLPPARGREFDPARLSDALLAARAVADEAVRHEADGRWWSAWRALERETGRPLTEGLVELSPRGLRFFTSWTLGEGDPEEGLVSLALLKRRRAGRGLEYVDTGEVLDQLLDGGRVDLAVAAVDLIAEDEGDASAEQCAVCLAMIDRGECEAALARIAPVLARYHDRAEVWAVTALGHHGEGAELEARRAMGEAARLGLFDEPLMERMRATFGRSWTKLAAQSPPGDYQDSERAWLKSPGADLLPTAGTSPHTFGGQHWTVPACRGCGHPIRVWFTLDVRALPSVAQQLPGWRFLPLLGCNACTVWMGRHDYQVDPVARALSLLNVAISTRRFGEAQGPPAALPSLPVEVRWRTPVLAPTERDLEPRWEAPQLGGAPHWTQQPLTVFCPACRKEMGFVAAMASAEAFPGGVHINNESGFQYHFACAPCHTLSVIAQWT
jgi:hypothetical protein